MKSGALLAIALLVSACGAKGGSSSSSSKNGAPSLSYETNPVNFTVAVAATADTLQVSNSVNSLSISPALPDGLAFDETSGAISGTPTTITVAADYVVTGTNSYGSNFVTLRLAVTDVLPTISYGGATTVVYTVGTAITPIAPTLGGGTTTSCTSSPALPTGLSLSTDCQLTGTPTQPVALNTYTISAQNSGGSAPLGLTITVQDVPPSMSYSPNTLSLYRGIAMSDASAINGGGTVVSCTSSPTLPTGLSLSSTCQITGTPSALSSSTAYSITATNSGGTSSATINIGVNDLLPSITFSPNTRTLSRNSAVSPGITATNTGGVINSCAVSPSLPTGLSISSLTCQVSGTPSAISSSTVYTFSATNAAGTATTSLTLTVNDIGPSIQYTSSPYVFPNLAAMTPVTPTNSGGPITGCTVSPTLPAALSLSTTCVISGTPSASSAAANYTVTASNSGGSSSQTISIAISQVAPIIAYSSNTYTFNKTVPITPQTVSNTGGPIVSCAVIPALPAGLSLSTTTCTISGTPTVALAASGYAVTATNSAGSSSETLTISITDSPPAFTFPSSPYILNLNQSISTITPSSTGGVITSCTSSPTLPTGLALNSSCGISGTPTVLSTATVYTITGTNAGGSSTAPITISVADRAPVITYAGSPYNFPLSAAITAQTPANTGGVPTSCTSSPTLPAGLTLAANCTLSGTPTALTASTSYTITGTNTGGSGSAAIVIAVSSLPVLAYSGSPFSFTVGTSIGTITPTNSGAAVTSCTVSPSLPAGLSLSTTCVLSGTPAAAAAAAVYTVSATNSSGSSSVDISITVNGIPILTYPNAPFAFTVGTPITSQTPINTGSAATSCASLPTLPAGLSLSTACVLSGTPTTPAVSASHTISGTNAVGTGTVSITIVVTAAAPNIAYAGSPYQFPTGTAISAKTPSNTGGTVVSCASSPTLPTGLALSATCVLSGTPTVVTAPTSYTITATNTGGTSSAAIVIGVGSVPALTYAGSPYSFTVGTSAGTITPTNSGSPVTSCSSSPSLPAGLSLSATCVMTGTPTIVSASSSYSITAANSAGSSSVSIAITVSSKPVLSYSGSPYTFINGTAITSQTPTNTGSAATSCSSAPTLPAGLSLSTACILSGTPTATSTATSYTISGTNASGTGTTTISITVNPAVPNITYGGSPYSFTENAAITSQTPGNTGGTITSCSSSPTLPAGLAISTTCVISGTPTAITASTSYTITATNAGGSGTTAIVISVGAAPALTYAGSPYSYTVGTAITTVTPTNTGGDPTSCTISPTLPGGLAMTSACVISGTPTIASPSTIYTITATNSSGTQNPTIAITVLGPPIISYPNTPYTFKRNTAMGPVAPNNTGSPATSCSSSPTLPTGFALSTACTISGTPTGLTSNTYTITGTNAEGSGSTAVSISVTLTGSALQAASRSLSTIQPNAPVILFYSKMPDGSSTSGTTHAWTVAQSLTNSSHAVETASDLAPYGVDYDFPPTYSPDGTKLAFVSKAVLSNGDVPASYNLWVMNRDGTNRIALTQNLFVGEDSFNPVFSPDSSTLYFQSKASIAGVTSQSFNIFKVDITGGNVTALTSQTGQGLDNTQPSISPDGKSIAFTSLMAVNGIASLSTNIWTMDTSGEMLEPLTLNTGSSLNSEDPSYSPEGSMILFSSQQAQAGSLMDIWEMENSGAPQVRLTAGTSDSRAPQMSLDSDFIVFVSKMSIGGVASSSTNVWEMNADGTSIRYLTGNTAAGEDSFFESGSVWVQNSP